MLIVRSLHGMTVASSRTGSAVDPVSYRDYPLDSKRTSERRLEWTLLASTNCYCAIYLEPAP